MYGDKYSYDVTRETYVKMKAKCIVHCNVHDVDFWVKPVDHLKQMHGGCPSCRRSKGIEREKELEERRKKRAVEREEKERIKRGTRG